MQPYKGVRQQKQRVFSMPDSNLEKQIYQTYLKAIENSVGSRIFNTLLVKNIKEKRVYDVLNDGERSCAFFVSGLLTFFDLIDRPHATVATVVKNIQKKDWTEIPVSNLKPGDIVVWETIEFDDGSQDEHIGFYLDGNRAVSTSNKKRCVECHHPTFGEIDGKPTRRIIEAYRQNNF